MQFVTNSHSSCVTVDVLDLVACDSRGENFELMASPGEIGQSLNQSINTPQGGERVA